MRNIAKIQENGEFAGKWFDPNVAIMAIKEDTRWNGNNWISKATDHQFHHEMLYYTKSRRFVLNSWSNFQGSEDKYELISQLEAAEWIVKNEFDDLDFLDELPEKVKEAVLAEIDAMEV